MPGIMTLAYIDSTTGRETPMTGESGAPGIEMKGGTTNYGNYPQNRYQNSTVTLAASATGTTVYELVDATTFNGFVFEVSAIAGTGVAIKPNISIDGTNYAAVFPQIINLLDGTSIAGATGVTGIGIYALKTHSDANVKYKGIKLIITGTAADLTCTVRYAHVWA